MSTPKLIKVVYLLKNLSTEGSVKNLLLSSSDNSLLGYQTNPNIDMLRELVHQVSRKIASFYDYDMVVTTVSDLIDPRSYARLLREMQREQELHMRKREVAVYLN